MLATRVTTAIILLAVFLAANFLLARPYFAALVTLVIIIGAHEWARLCRLPGAAAVGYAAALGAAHAALAFAPGLSIVSLVAVATVFWIIVAPLWLWRGVRAQARPALAASSVIVLLPAGIAAVALRPWALLGLLALVWLADSAAFFAGRAFGRRKLAPSISPGKTWAGFAGALLATLAYAIICVASIPSLAMRVHGAVWLAYLVGAALLCSVSVVGDLFESALKRQAGAKDSGGLLPGHGGVLDRIDSATAALPTGALLLHWILVR